MKVKIYNFFILGLIFFTCSVVAQPNIAPSATVSHSGGGSGVYGPAEYNNNSISTCPSLPWGWTSSGGTITFNWGSTQTFSGVTFYKGDRPMTDCDIQYWNGSSWIQVATNIGGGSCDITYNFSATGSQLRFTQVNGSNPNFREIRIYGCSCTPCSFSTQSNSTIWTGAVDDDWVKSGNWTNGTPNSTKNAYIPNCPTQPTLYGNGTNWPAADCRTLTVFSDDGAVLTWSGTTSILNVHGAF